MRCWWPKRRKRFWRTGHSATVFEDPEPADWDAYKDKYALVVTSTTGQGDLPDSIVPLFQYIRDKIGYQPALRYCVIALGDSTYTNFCGGGKQFDALLQEQSAQRVGEVLLIDASEDPSLSRFLTRGWNTGRHC
jgi:flavodoxin